jgi:hypothetical protein
MFSRNVRTVKCEDGREAVLVTVNKEGSKICFLWKEDFQELLSLGVSPNWLTPPNRNNVLASGATRSKSKLGVARVLMDCKAGEGIRYKDGNCLNLRRENLEVVPDPRGKRRDRDHLPVKKRRPSQSFDASPVSVAEALA